MNKSNNSSKPFDNKEFIATVTKNLKVAENQLKVVNTELRNLTSEIRGLKCFSSSTSFGSELSDNVFAVSQCKYHKVRWKYALKVIQKRHTKFSKLLSRIKNRKQQGSSYNVR